MSLPNSQNLPINKLASVFNSRVTTYKYYWMLAIIELVEEGKTTISKTSLFTRMIANSWYTINYFHISFGKQDLIQQAVQQLLEIEKLSIDEKKQQIISKIENSNNEQTQSILYHFDKNVPHWFLSPWFPKCNDKEIYSLSKTYENNCVYALDKDNITVNPNWIDYLKANSKVLKDFCYWNLSLFLQSRNPNVPDIPNKLIKPATRGSLSLQTKNYWKNVFHELKSVECIFTKKSLVYEEKNFALDHFVPHAFVSHNLIWNLIPIDKNYNSRKSDKLPSMDKHFDAFYDLQRVAFDINRSLKEDSKCMEEFITIFNDLNTFNKERYRETIYPLVTIASNNGFGFFDL